MSLPITHVMVMVVMVTMTIIYSCSISDSSGSSSSSQRHRGLQMLGCQKLQFFDRQVENFRQRKCVFKILVLPLTFPKMGDFSHKFLLFWSKKYPTTIKFSDAPKCSTATTPMVIQRQQ